MLHYVEAIVLSHFGYLLGSDYMTVQYRHARSTVTVQYHHARSTVTVIYLHTVATLPRCMFQSNRH